MNAFDFLQIFVSFAAIAVSAPLLGRFFARVYRAEPHLFRKPFGWLETLSEKVIGNTYRSEMDWKKYAYALLAFNILGLTFTFLIQMFQAHLPLNPQNLPNVSWHLAINTAISFVTNTNWQAYSGEATMSNFTQMFALTVQNFVSAGTGLAVAVALARGISGRNTKNLGNFWQDLVRGVVYILLPFAMILSVALVSEGVVQSFSAATEITTVEGVKQIIPVGAVASQVAIKQLGSNGGGFYGVNSSHPLENPTPFSNWLEMISLIFIAGGVVFMFGNLVGDRKHGRILFFTMFSLLAVGFAISLWSELGNNAAIGASAMMEGKETRFGVIGTVLWSTFTTVASNGAVNSMHSSLSPLAGGTAMFNMMLGEVIFGGVGTGLYGMILFVILAVFLAGLMVGRTPEYLGKKIEAFEVKMTLIAVILPSACILIGTAISAVTPVGLSSLANKGPHGLSEILYAFTSAAANNGSAFAGLNGNTPYYNLMLGAAMLIGRFGVIIPVLAIAGSLAAKKTSPASFGTFTTDNALFMALLISTILIVGGLTFFPVLSLGPIIEHFLMQSGRTF